MFKIKHSFLRNPFLYILILGFGLRFYHLGYFDLWFDEILSTCSKKMAVSHLNPHLPLYSEILRFVVHILGDNEFILRLPSAVAGSFSIIILYELSKLIFDRKTALLASFILSISPFHIWYSQEARVFAIFTFVVLLYILILSYIILDEKNKYWLLLFISQTLCLYLSYWFLLMLPIISIIFVFRKERRALKKWFLCSGLSMILFFPKMLSLREHIALVKNNFWLSPPQFKQIIITIENFNLGYNANQILYVFSLFVFGSMVFLACKKLLQKKEFMILFLSLAFLPIILVFIISQILPIYVDKVFLVCIPYYYILIGYGLNQLKKTTRKIYILFIVIMVSMSLLNYYRGIMPLSETHHKGVPIKGTYKLPVKYVYDNFQTGDILVFTVSEFYASFLYYLYKVIDEKEKYPFYWFYSSEMDDKYWLKLIRKAPHAVNVTTEYNKIKIHKRIWLISGKWIRDGTLDKNSLFIKKWLLNKYRKINEICFDGMFVGLYKKNDN